MVNVESQQSRKDCSRNCDNLCMNKAKSLSEENALKLKDFKKQSTIETKNNLLKYLWAQDCIVPDDKDGFVFDGSLFCLRSFSKLTDISVFILQQVVDHFERGAKYEFSHQGKDVRKLNSKSVNFVAWYQARCTSVE